MAVRARPCVGKAGKKSEDIKTVKLAPFKLHFSKPSKSRSGGSKGSRSNSVESEDNSSQQQSLNAAQLLTTSNCLIPQGGESNNNSLTFRNDTTVPSSPPPSYEYVLEETRMEQSAEAQAEEEKDEEDVEKVAKKEKNAIGGGDGGGGPGDGLRTPAKRPEILHKSSKEFYRAVAKQWGITCKMSDHCRCFDCQSHYFDCEYEKDEQEKTDGGLGAGTPMFISEVIHGTACALL